MPCCRAVSGCSACPLRSGLLLLGREELPGIDRLAYLRSRCLRQAPRAHCPRPRLSALVPTPADPHGRRLRSSPASFSRAVATPPTASTLTTAPSLAWGATTRLFTTGGRGAGLDPLLRSEAPLALSALLPVSRWARSFLRMPRSHPNSKPLTRCSPWVSPFAEWTQPEAARAGVRLSSSLPLPLPQERHWQ